MLRRPVDFALSARRGAVSFEARQTQPPTPSQRIAPRRDADSRQCPSASDGIGWAGRGHSRGTVADDSLRVLCGMNATVAAARPYRSPRRPSSSRRGRAGAHPRASMDVPAYSRGPKSNDADALNQPLASPDHTIDEVGGTLTLGDGTVEETLARFTNRSMKRRERLRVPTRMCAVAEHQRR